jgi:hypothetical protein
MAVRLSALLAAHPLPPGRFLVLISLRGWVNPSAAGRISSIEGNMMTSSGIKPATLQLLIKYESIASLVT